MEPGDETVFVRQLAYEWAQVKLPTQGLGFGDYIRAVSGLQQSTNNMGKTRAIFRAVIQQASQLAKSSEWVEAELRFEALADFVEDRAGMLIVELAYNGPVDDAALDRYNERVSRFKAVRKGRDPVPLLKEPESDEPETVSDAFLRWPGWGIIGAAAWRLTSTSNRVTNA